MDDFGFPPKFPENSEKEETKQVNMKLYFIVTASSISILSNQLALYSNPL